MMKKDVEMPLYDAFIHLLDTGEEDEVFDTIETIKDDPRVHEDIYRLAKRYYTDNKPLAIKLINTIINNRKYFTGWRAYTDCIDNDEKSIDDMLNYKKIIYQAGQLDDEEYIKILNEIVFSIAGYYPSKAKDLLEEINNVYTAMNEEGNDSDEV